jgi:hypothetical protein
MVSSACSAWCSADRTISVIRSGGRPLDQLGSAAPDQLVADSLLAAFDRCDVLSQPGRQRLSVGHAAVPKAGVRANLAAVALRREAGELEGRKLAGWHASSAGEVRHGVVAQLVGSARETTAPEQELQQRREPQWRRAGLEVIDDLIQSQVARHLSGRSGRSAGS